MDKGSQSSAGDTNTERRGIFSTPELTVDTEKIAGSTEAAAEASRAKIASIFANTETGRQSQRLNDAMVANSQPATEDIVINNSPKKKRRWPIVLVILALVAVAGGVLTFFLTQMRPSPSAATPLSLFEDYINYAKYGPQGDSTSEDTSQANAVSWYIDGLHDMGLTMDEISSYLTELDKRYQNFLKVDIHDGLADDGLVLHQRLLSALSDYYSLDRFESEVVNKYLHEGDNAAQQYIEEVAPAAAMQSNESENILDMAKSLEHNYLNARLSVLRRYKVHGCITEAELDIACTLDNTDFQTQQEEQLANEIRSSLASLMPLLQNHYHSSAEAILNSLERV